VLGRSKYIDIVPYCARYVVRLTYMLIKVADGLSRLCLCNCIEPCMEGTNALTYCTTLVDRVRLAVGKCFGFLVDQPQNLAHPLKQVQICFTIKNTDFRNIYNSTTNLNCFCQHDSRIFEHFTSIRYWWLKPKINFGFLMRTLKCHICKMLVRVIFCSARFVG